MPPFANIINLLSKLSTGAFQTFFLSRLIKHLPGATLQKAHHMDDSYLKISDSHSLFHNPAGWAKPRKAEAQTSFGTFAHRLGWDSHTGHFSALSGTSTFIAWSLHDEHIKLTQGDSVQYFTVLTSSTSQNHTITELSVLENTSKATESSWWQVLTL